MNHACDCYAIAGMMAAYMGLTLIVASWLYRPSWRRRIMMTVGVAVYFTVIAAMVYATLLWSID